MASTPAAALEIIGRAQRDTQQKVSSTLDRVGQLDERLTARIEKLDAKVDELAVSSARVEGALTVLNDAMHQDRIERREIRVSKVQAVIEVEKTGEVAKINEAVAVRADRRQLRLKIAAAVGPVVAAIATYLLARC